MKYSFNALLICVLLSCTSSSEADPSPSPEKDPLMGYTMGNLPLEPSKGFVPQGHEWMYLPAFSDEFDYTGKDQEFQSKWKDTYFNAWIGPGLTEWNSSHSNVENGELILKASRKTGTEKVYCGVISSKEKIKFPIYTEVRAKVANQVLSSNFWFLSQDDTREIDILEVYGGDRPDQKWFAARPSTNYHIFVRNDKNQILENYDDQKHHPLPGETPYREDYHLFGAYWKDAFTIDFYYDGQLVRELRKEGIEDPSEEGLNREMFMIIDLEDHDWRSFPAAGTEPIRATDAELADETKNKYRIDYVRTYRPADSFDGGLIKNGSFTDASLEAWYWKGQVQRSLLLYETDGDATALSLAGADASIAQKVEVDQGARYQLSFRAKALAGLQLQIPSLSQESISASTDWKDYQIEFDSGDMEEIILMITNKENQAAYIDKISLKKL